ncbi:MAG TPA: glycosyltransferase [Jatrophihabitans sp.]|nr:glycosyltransferase [Jatrophihabitans sp.]
MHPRVGVVVLTQGTRPDELAAALASVRSQRDVQTDVVVVGNGWRPSDLPAGVRGLHLPDNVGIPAGRNAGVALVEGEFVLFLDDDARLASPDFLTTVLAKFRADARLGLVQPRVDASEGQPPRRWVPRLRKGDRRRSSLVFSCWEGAVVVRRDAFLQAGEWPERFFYAHEGIDIAFRLWSSGYRVLYAGDVAAVHPPINPRRHAEYHHNNARNRVWIARRNLPWPVSWIYVTSWTVVQLARAFGAGEVATLRPWFAGWWAGWRTDGGPCRRMSWSTVWRMTRFGRPPII